MAQFSVHRNPDPATKARFPLLLDLQNDLVAELGTRVVAPLCPVSAMKGQLIKTLTPVWEIDGKEYAMLTPQLAGIPARRLGAEVADLARCRGDFLAALDLLFTGI